MSSKTLHVLAVSRDPTIRQIVEDVVGRDGSPGPVLGEPERIFSAPVGVLEFLLLDESATGAGYLPVIKRARKRFPALDVMVIGGPKSDDVKRREKREGVDYYVERPIETNAVKSAINHRLSIARIKASSGIVGRSPHIEEILETILQVAPTEVPILIEGESGTGKDVVAHATHLASRRKDGPYVAINCGSLAEGVLESELFGHEKGAFTGAVSQRVGMFERANRGTIFLDEVGETSPNMQVRLLRVLESGEVLRVGGVKNFQVDVRVIAATNRSLSAAVRNGAFRQDLYFRLKGVSFYLPPLRERREDIPILVDVFVQESNQKHHKDVRGVESEAMLRLLDYRWPGNIRELRNMIDTLVVLSPGNRITADLVESQMEGPPTDEEPRLPIPLNLSRDVSEREMLYASILALHRDVREILERVRERGSGGPWEQMREVHSPGPPEQGQVQPIAQLERSAIQEALRVNGGNRRKAAFMLGISERTLYRKIKEYGLV